MSKAVRVTVSVVVESENSKVITPPVPVDSTNPKSIYLERTANAVVPVEVTEGSKLEKKGQSRLVDEAASESKINTRWKKCIPLELPDIWNEEVPKP